MWNFQHIVTGFRVDRDGVGAVFCEGICGDHVVAVRVAIEDAPAEPAPPEQPLCLHELFSYAEGIKNGKQ